MNIYIWRRVKKLTDRYHEEGGVVAVAATLEGARNIVGKPLPEPDFVYVLADPEAPEVVVVFPDSGCC